MVMSSPAGCIHLVVVLPSAPAWSGTVTLSPALTVDALDVLSKTTSAAIAVWDAKNAIEKLARKRAVFDVKI